MDKIKFWLKYFALTIALLAFWEYSSRVGWLPPYVLPPPYEIVELFFETLLDGTLFKHILISMQRVMLGFLAAAAVALILGVLVSISKNVEVTTRLILQVFRPIPPIAWIPLAILWLGIDEESKVFVIFIGSVFPILLNTIDGIRQIDKRYIEVSRTFEIPRLKLIRKVIIPGAFPQILTGMKLGLGSSIACVVAAEMIAADAGIGYMLSDGRSLSQPGKVVLAMFLVGIIGKFMEDILKHVQKKTAY